MATPGLRRREAGVCAEAGVAAHSNGGPLKWNVRRDGLRLTLMGGAGVVVPASSSVEVWGLPGKLVIGTGRRRRWQRPGVSGVILGGFVHRSFF